MPPFAAGTLVFFTSAAVLVLEILAGRLLAPYVGVTLETYTGIIGVVLAAIAVGTWQGGRLADRVNPRSTVGPLLVLGGALTLLTVPAIRLVGAANLGADPLAVVLLSLVGFFAPAAVLSAVNPNVVKLQLRELAHTGRVVGQLSALGTTGAIFGTFVTGFLLVAALPTQPIVFTLGVVLAASGLVLWAVLRPRGTTPAAFASLAFLGGVLTLSAADPCTIPSAYFCARIVPDAERATGRVLFLDNLRHSYVDVADPTYLGFSYAQVLGDVLETRPAGPLDVLHIGGGGFSLPRYIAATREGSENVVLELDPALVQTARERLALRTGPDLRVRTGDARVNLRSEPSSAYDVVIGDAFGGQAVPWHLTTVEFVEEIRRTLRPEGLYALNLIDYPPLGFARAEAATLQQVFRHVAVIAPRERLVGAAGGNFILVASDAPIDSASIEAANRARGDDDEVLLLSEDAPFVEGATVLRDDYAPVDQLLTPAT